MDLVERCGLLLEFSKERVSDTDGPGARDDRKFGSVGFVSSCRIQLAPSETGHITIWQRAVGRHKWVGYATEQGGRRRATAWAKALLAAHPARPRASPRSSSSPGLPSSNAFLRIYNGPSRETREALRSHFETRDHATGVAAVRAVMDRRARLEHARTILLQRPVPPCGAESSAAAYREQEGRAADRYRAFLEAMPSPDDDDQGEARLDRLVAASSSGRDDDGGRRRELNRLVRAELDADAAQEESFKTKEAALASMYDGILRATRVQPERRASPRKVSHGL